MRRIMLVDDEMYVRSSIRNRMNWESLDLAVCAEASDGAEALSLLDATRPDILIVDVRMPVMDGIELVEAVKACRPNVQFIVLSGYSDFPYVRSALRLGAVHYLTKPVNLEELTEALRLAVERLRANEEAREGQHARRERQLNRLLEHGLHSQPEGGLKLRYSHATLAAWAAPNTLAEHAAAELLESSRAAVGLTAELYPFRLEPCKEAYCVLANHEPGERRAAEAFVERLSSLVGPLAVYGPAPLGGERRPLAAALLRTLRGKLFHPGTSVLKAAEPDAAPEQEQTDLARLFRGADMLRSALEQHNRRAADEVLEMIFRDALWQLRPIEALDVLLAEIGNAMKQVVLEEELGPNAYDEAEELFHPGYALRFGDLAELAADLKDRIGRVMVPARSESDGELIGQIQAYLEKHYHEDLTLQGIAGRFYLSAAYLSHYFKKKTNRNLFQYLEDIRIREAKSLLGLPSLKVTDVAAQVGFKDANYFSKVFARRVGITPSKYRELQ